jgi:penicillin V acylase-like amidase (Ntn superfamily)
MHGALKEVILSGPQSLTSSDIELIRRKTEAKYSSDNENENKNEIVDYDIIRWMLLSGASAQEAEAQLLSGAVSIFHVRPFIYQYLAIHYILFLFFLI